MFENLYKSLISEEQRAMYRASVEYVERKSLLYSPDRDGKLNGISVLNLSKNCGRAAWILRMIADGILPEETEVTSCYGGKCWQEFTTANNFEKKRQQVETIAKYKALVVKADTVTAMVKPNTKNFKNTVYFREGQTGDSSHAFIIQECGFSAAVAWLQACREKGETKKTVFITAGYAPVTMEEWKSLKPYRDMFKIHFSLSGWFSREEINARLAMFEACRAAGLDPIVRIVTNKDNISSVAMANESYLLETLQALNVDRVHILETPFHDDSKKGDILKRSRYSLERGPVCCDTGKCSSCKFHCMTEEK